MTSNELDAESCATAPTTSMMPPPPIVTTMAIRWDQTRQPGSRYDTMWVSMVRRVRP
jgi:hypothetical protein